MAINGQVIGDPHFLSFDGRSYSYSGICSNLLAMDCEAGQWYVYGRMTACGDNLTGSCLETVTLYIGAGLEALKAFKTLEILEWFNQLVLAFC